MLPDGRRLGAHLPLGAGMVRQWIARREIGANALQIFGDNPTAWRRRAEPPREQPAFRERLRELRHPAGRDPRRLPRQPGRARRRLLRALRRGADQRHPQRPGLRGELRQRPHRIASRRRRRCRNGANRRWRRPGDCRDGRRTGRRRCSSSRTPPVADSGSERRSRSWPTSPTRSPLAASPSDRVGFCLDAAHAWGAGYRLSDPDATDELLDGFDSADRDRPPADGPPQRLQVRARLADGSSRARRRRADRRGRHGPPPSPPLPRRGHVLPRDAGHGRGLRRDQHRPGDRARRRAAARAPAAGRDDGSRQPGAVGPGARAPSAEPDPEPTPVYGSGARPPPRVDRPADARPPRARGARPAGRGAALRRPADARDMGRRPGPRHARPPGPRPIR